jgi:NADH dehydrogenase [ubiquinone] 1 alpha subcomplex assembly factor 6
MFFSNYDSPSYTLAHFIEPHMLPAYFAIRAFNIELARIPDVVSMPHIGSMRMQFWRNTIDQTFKLAPPMEPVAIVLAAYLKQGGKLNKTWFQRIISARDRKLTHPGFTNLAELETYAESTYSTLLYLTLSALPLKSVEVDHLASHVGKAAGIAAVLRGVPLEAFPPPPGTHAQNPSSMGGGSRERQGVVTLPLDVMSQCGVREEDIFHNGPNAVGIRDAVFTTATRASDHLITARELLKNIQQFQDPSHEFEHINDEGHDYTTYDQGVRISKGKRKENVDEGFGIVMGPAVSTQLWLDRLQKVDFDIFNDSLRRAEWKLPFVAWLRNRSGKL